MSTPMTWITVGHTVIHRKTGKEGIVLAFTGVTKSEKLHVEWEDGSKQWIDRKKIKVK